jgi:hypothetical protein
MFGAEGNKDYRIKTIKYKALLVAGKNLPFGTIKKTRSDSFHASQALFYILLTLPCRSCLICAMLQQQSRFIPI